MAVAVSVGIVNNSGAQQGQSAYIYAQAEGDDAVVVTVSGLPVTRGDVRKASELRRSYDQTMTEDQADAVTISVFVSDKAILAEGIARELAPSEEELDAFIGQYQADCEIEEARPICEEGIRDMGLTYDEFWKVSRPDYSNALLSNKVHRDNFERKGLGEDATDEELFEVTVAFEGEVLAEATVVWNDDRLRRLYEGAVAE